MHRMPGYCVSLGNSIECEIHQVNDWMKNATAKENPQPLPPRKLAAIPPLAEQRMRFATYLVFALSAGLVLAAARGDLWFDEIWSILFADQASSPADIYFKFQHDNNHLINTLYQYLVGKQDILFLHRLPAIAAGIGSIWLVGIIANKWGQTERLVATLLAGTSFPLLLYFSEARGYAPAIFCALLCFALLQEEQPRLEARRVGIFWIASIVGSLSHATFVIALAALLCLAVVQQHRRDANSKSKRLRLWLFFLVPMVFLAFYFISFARHIEFGGGPVYTQWDVVCRTASYTLGLPEGRLWGPLALGCVAAVTAAGTLQLYRKRSAQWIFFPIMLFVAPMLLIVVTQPTYLYFRYFVVCIPFFYILLSCVAARHLRSANRPIRWMVVAAVLLYVTAQGLRIAPLLHLGRGSYMAAVEYIASDSPNHRVGIGSDHDFRNKMLFAFYTQFLPEPNRLYYIDHPDWKRTAPDWLVTHSQNRTFRPPKQLTIPDVGEYALVKEYRFAGISGWHWFLYRLN